MKNHRELQVMQLCISFPTETMRTGEERTNKESWAVLEGSEWNRAAFPFGMLTIVWDAGVETTVIGGHLPLESSLLWSRREGFV